MFTNRVEPPRAGLRYGADEIYTRVSDILISVNPFKLLPIYTPEVLGRYVRAGAGASKLPPHCYAVAAAAHAGLVGDDRSQAICISGESGAAREPTPRNGSGPKLREDGPDPNVAKTSMLTCCTLDGTTRSLVPRPQVGRRQNRGDEAHAPAPGRGVVARGPRRA